MAVFGRTVFCAALFTLSSATAAKAVLLTFAYEGTVTLDQTASGFVGETLRFEFTFESTTPDSEGSPTLGLYSSSLTAYTVSLMGMTWTYAGPGTGFINVASNADPTGDFFYVQGSILSGPPLGGQPVSLIRAQFLDPSDGNVVVGSDSLPATPPEPSSFLTVSRLLLRNANGDDVRADGTLSISAVPAPPALPLLGAGVLALAWMRRRKVKAALP